ncbi:MAG: hypothetical protein K8W52_09155 [Deltaproteobacteria bacterium]|nr:hypothetical protein [Deltaproteobacteria bacterium]
MKSPGLGSPLLFLVTLLPLAACGDANSPAPIAVDGGTTTDATTGAPIAVLPSTLDVGAVDCGGAAAITFELGNRGGAPLDYTLAALDERVSLDPASGTVAPGERRTVRVTVAMPAEVDAAVPFATDLTFTSNDASAPHAVPLAFRSHGAQIVIDPPGIGFGETAVGFAATRTFAVTNRGDVAAQIAIAAPGGEFARRFGDSGRADIAPGATLEGDIAYLPQDLGRDQRTADVALTGPRCGRPVAPLALDGEGRLGDDVRVEGGPIDFGDVTCDDSTETATLTLVNPTAIAAPFTAAIASGAVAGVTISPASGQVPAGGSLALQVRRREPAGSVPGAQQAILRITTSLGAARTHDIELRQQVHTPLLEVAAARDFGVVPPGDIRALPVTITNHGDAPADLAVFSSDPAFVTQLPTWLGQGSTATGWFTYVPISDAPVDGTMTVFAASSCAAPTVIPLSAGHGPRPSFAPTLSDFFTCPLPATLSAALAVANTGDRPLVMSCRETTPSALAPQISPSVLTVAPGGTGAITVSVTPTSCAAGWLQVALTCTTNELFTSTHTAQVGWSIWDPTGGA